MHRLFTIFRVNAVSSNLSNFTYIISLLTGLIWYKHNFIITITTWLSPTRYRTKRPPFITFGLVLSVCEDTGIFEKCLSKDSRMPYVISMNSSILLNSCSCSWYSPQNYTCYIKNKYPTASLLGYTNNRPKT